MIFNQLFDQKSSTYTYIISSGKGREALIIDPVIEHTDEYINLAEKTVQSVNNLYSKSETKVFKPKDLPDEINNYAKSHSKGYGYWAWKPYIVQKALSTLNENDILSSSDLFTSTK